MANVRKSKNPLITDYGPDVVTADLLKAGVLVLGSPGAGKTGPSSKGLAENILSSADHGLIITEKTEPETA